MIERDMVETSGLLGILGEAVLSSYLPCLILPSRWNREIAFERVVVGWNNSVEATRALHSALPFLRVARQVTLIDGESSGPDATVDKLPRFDPFVYLLRHHIIAKPLYVRTTPDRAGEILLNEAQTLQADLLVMGACGHSRMRERVFGGATRHVLAHACIPVLMQH